jgi:type III restriction enzyme
LKTRMQWHKAEIVIGKSGLEKDGEERIYFVVETKSGLFTDDLRDKESANIECCKAHFKALSVGETPARYVVAWSLDDVLNE